MFEEHIFSLLICSDIQESHFGEVSYSASHSVVSDPLPPTAQQASLSMGFSRQEYWSALPFASPGDLPNPGIEPVPPTLQVDSLLSEAPDG